MEEERRRRVLEACQHFVEAVAGRALPGFEAEHVWSGIPGLAARHRSRLDLPQNAAQMLSGLSAQMGLAPGASARTIAATLMSYFGPCPHPNEVLLEACEYVRNQVNGAFGQSPPKPPMPDLGF
jgi:hypothetical protein